MNTFLKATLFSGLLLTSGQQQAASHDDWFASPYVMAAGAAAIAGGAYAIYSWFSVSDETLLERAILLQESYSHQNVLKVPFPYAALMGVRSGSVPVTVDYFCNEDCFCRCLDELCFSAIRSGASIGELQLPLAANPSYLPGYDRSLVNKITKRVRKLEQQPSRKSDAQKHFYYEHFKSFLAAFDENKKRHEFEYAFIRQLQDYIEAHASVDSRVYQFDAQIPAVSLLSRAVDLRALKERILAYAVSTTEVYPYRTFMRSLEGVIEFLLSLQKRYTAAVYPCLYSKSNELLNQLNLMKSALATDVDYRSDMIRYEEKRQVEARHRELLAEQRRQNSLQAERNRIAKERNNIEFYKAVTDSGRKDDHSDHSTNTVNLYC